MASSLLLERMTLMGQILLETLTPMRAEKWPASLYWQAGCGQKMVFGTDRPVTLMPWSRNIWKTVPNAFEAAREAKDLQLVSFG